MVMPRPIYRNCRSINMAKLLQGNFNWGNQNDVYFLLQFILITMRTYVKFKQSERGY